MGNEPTTSFAQALAKELELHGLSIRKLGGMLDPSNPERGRRRIQRHLSDTKPTSAWRTVYATVLRAPHLKKGSERGR